MENANECTFKKYGPGMIDVAVKQMEATIEFQQQFKSLITDCLLQSDTDVNVTKFDLAIKLIYDVLLICTIHAPTFELIALV